MDQTPPDHPQTGQREGAEVISLGQTLTSEPRRGALAEIDAYWHALRGTRLVPARSDVDPRGIEGALSFAFIVERIAPGHARIRIAGTHLTDLMGMEVRGMPLSALFEPQARPNLQGAVRCLFEDPAIQTFHLTSEGRIGKPALKARMALYPLRNDLGDISRALGCLVTEGTLGRAPRRFNIRHAQRKALTEPDTALLTAFETPGPSPVAAAAEPVETFQSTAVPWLRVVKDQDA